MQRKAVIAAVLAVLSTCSVYAQDNAQPEMAKPTAETNIAPVTAPEPTTTVAGTPAQQETPKPASFEMPMITSDTEIFRRTPIIDGVIESGEWDTFYSFSTQGWDATTYVDWDSKNLYIAIKSSCPVDVMSVIDANADGWFHGEDNYEFKTTSGPNDTVTLSMSKYESRNTKSPLATPVSPEETALIETKCTKTESAHMIEMRIPSILIKELKLAPGKKFGLQICLNAEKVSSGWVPTKEHGDTRECSLVTKKLVALKPLELGFDLRDNQIAIGDEVVGKFHLTNSGTETLDVRSYIIGGEGKSGEYLSSEKVRIEGISPKKHIAHEIKSVIPGDMRLGCWAIGAEVRSGTERLGSALISFEVVEPFAIELKTPSATIKPDAKDVSFIVAIKNYTRGRMRGKAKITLPVGWELWKNTDTKQFMAQQGEDITSVLFKAKPPLGVSGDVPIKIAVEADGKTITTEGKIIVANP